jgi:DNA repair protein RadC
MSMILREAEVVYKPGKRIDANRDIRSSDDAHQILKEYNLHNRTVETMVVLILDTRHRVIAAQTVAVGTLTSVEVHPREVFRAAVMQGAAAILMAHNHPSGDPTPSEDDLNITTRIKQAGSILGILVLDHLILGADDTYYVFSIGTSLKSAAQ